VTASELVRAIREHTGGHALAPVIVLDGTGRHRRIVEVDSESIGGGDRSKGDPIHVLLVLDDDEVD
jgi:hypothetical protein